jgi:hypothetical protein
MMHLWRLNYGVGKIQSITEGKVLISGDFALGRDDVVMCR